MKMCGLVSLGSFAKAGAKVAKPENVPKCASPHLPKLPYIRCCSADTKKNITHVLESFVTKSFAFSNEGEG